METLKDNFILKTLQEIFKSYKPAEGTESLTKYQIIQIFYDYNIIDTCGYNIFHINNFLNQLAPSEDQIDIKNFLILIFYIYRTQQNSEFEESEGNEVSVDHINQLSDNMKDIFSSNNIIKIMQKQKEKKERFFAFQTPLYSDPSIKEIFSTDNLNTLSNYMNSINDTVFNRYIIFDQEKKISYVTINGLNNGLFDYPIYANIDGKKLSKLSHGFMKVQLAEDILPELYDSLFEEKLNAKQIDDLFHHLDMPISDYNFSYSAYVIILALFAMNIESSQEGPFEEQIQFFFEKQGLLLRDDAEEGIEQITEEEQEEEDVDFGPDSSMLNNAKKRQHGRNEIEFMDEMLTFIDKNLPPLDENILAFSNDVSDHSNTIQSNKKKIIPAKYPVDKLQVEVEEERDRIIELKENKMIEKAKKAKKEKDKNPNPFEFDMEPIPTPERSKEQYYGKDLVETLTHRLGKHTIKDILPNSNVYPSLIKEVLMIPQTITSKGMELIVESMKDQVSGHFETSIRRLEKAKDLLPKDLIEDPQINLFFNCSFGSLYETGNFDIVALKYYYDAKSFSDKLGVVDPDTALVYCFLGEMFVKGKEFQWAMRCYLKAKEIREQTIGGDTPDTAAVYNNLGVVAYHLQSFLPANGYFKGAYEIYKSVGGGNHQRTMMIKANLSKMNLLNFNKVVEFKTLSLYQTPYQMMANGRKKK